MTLSGYFVASPSGEEIERKMIEGDGKFRGNKIALRFRGIFLKLKQWEEYELTSDVRLLEDASDLKQREPPFSYRVVCVLSGAKLILLCDRKKIADYALSGILARRIFPSPRKVGVRVDRVIDACKDANNEYLLTSLHGRFAGPERALTSISLYGGDITDSPIFRAHAHLFNFHSCGIGRRLVDSIPQLGSHEDSEIVQIGNDGFLSNVLARRERALEMMRVINYVMTNRWVDAWVPGITEKESGSAKHE